MASRRGNTGYARYRGGIGLPSRKGDTQATITQMQDFLRQYKPAHR